MRLRVAWVLASAVLAVAGCGGSKTTPPPPPVVPAVTSATPANGATGVAINSAVAATFSQTMTSSTLTASTFTLSGPGGTAVAGVVTYASIGSVATFTPSANLAYGTQYTATLTTGATDSAGTALSANYTWTFTTAAAPVPPTVTSTTPANAATAVPTSSALTATFSQAMTASTITSATFTLTGPGATVVAGAVTYAASGSIATFTPSANLAYNTLYMATITTGAQDSTGTALAANYVWTFTTAPAPTPPTVISTTPANAANAVAINPAVTATFSQPMTTSTITSATFTLTGPGATAVAGTVSATGSTATFTPSANLAYDTLYTATITTGAQDSTGTALAAKYTWSFTTLLAPVPVVEVTTPINGATDVAINADLTATFSQPMYAPTVDAATFLLTATGGATVAGTVTYAASGSIATFTPAANLAYNTQYTATITTGAEDSALAPLAANYTWSFATGANPNLVTVDFGTADQIIRGFGGSTAWLGQLTIAQATALYSPGSGLGLSILRVRIDPTGTLADTWVPTNGAWLTEAKNAQEAVSANPNAIVFASPWTPPASMKTSSTSQPYYSGTCSPAAGYCGGYLDPSNYAAYATYLEDFVTYFNANSGISLYAISMQNEPDYPDVNYESSYWTPAQMDAWIAGNASVLTTSTTTPNTKLIMPESFQFIPAQALTALDDPNAEGLIGIIGGHIYGVSPAPYTIPSQDSPKDLWMTEHALMPAGSQPTITDALAAAEEVHNSMVTGEYNAYVWWWIWDNPSESINYGLINSSTTSPAPTYYGYAIGQFAKFIQPGYYRYNATANPSTNVYVSAYAGMESGQQHYVIVAINATATAVAQSFSLENGAVTTLTPYQTTSGGGLAAQSSITVSNGEFNYTLPAQSITTFVQ